MSLEVFRLLFIACIGCFVLGLFTREIVTWIAGIEDRRIRRRSMREPIDITRLDRRPASNPPVEARRRR